MGQPANVIDWTEGSGAFAVVDRSASTLPPLDEPLGARADSAVLLKSPGAWEPIEDSEDEPTQPFIRAAPALSAPDPIADLTRATDCAAARLGALLEWVADEDPSSGVVDFVTAFLVELGPLNQALDGLACALRASPSAALRMTGEAFLRAAALWRANLVDHVDELALTQHDSLEGWSSLPEYSAMYTLAFVMPALDSVKDWTVAARDEGLALSAPLREVEVAVFELNWLLKRAAVERAGR